MTVDAFALLVPGLQMLPRWPEEPAWGDALEDWYFACLSDVPDALAPALAHYMGRACRRRPVPAELIDKAGELLAGQKPLPVAALEEAFRLRRTLGARCVQDGWLVPTRAGEPIKSRDTGLLIRVPHMVEGEPEFTDPLTVEVIRAMGGWTHFCEVDAPGRILETHFERAYAAIRDHQSPSVLRGLQTEFGAEIEAARLARPALPELDDSEGLHPAPENGALTRQQASEAMRRVSQHLGHAVPVGRRMEAQ